MKIFAIYVTISIIDLILVLIQIKVLKDQEERENNIIFKFNHTATLAEDCLAILKALIIILTPLVRTAITMVILFSEEMQDSIVDHFYHISETEQK